MLTAHRVETGQHETHVHVQPEKACGHYVVLPVYFLPGVCVLTLCCADRMVCSLSFLLLCFSAWRRTTEEDEEDEEGFGGVLEQRRATSVPALLKLN